MFRLGLYVDHENYSTTNGLIFQCCWSWRQ